MGTSGSGNSVSREGYDAIVVGAGAIGLAAAWRACQRGVRTLVVDAAEPGSGASHVAAGMLAPVTEATFGEEESLALNLEAARRYPSFVEELEAESGTEVGYRASGTLAVALDRDHAEALRRLHGFHLSLGLEAEWLRGRECRALEPGLSPAVVGGIRTSSDHQISPRALCAALARAVERAGGELRPFTRVARIEISGDRVCGLKLDCGQLVDADSIVVAAGWQSGEIAGLPPDAGVPVRPVKGQAVRLRDPAGRPPAGRVIRTPEVYLVPRRDGELVVGATVEERGADCAVTAGGVLELLRAAYEALPGVTELELSEASAGLRPTSPDNKPIVGPGALEGLVWATGHWRNGILLAGVTADAVAGVLAGGELPPTLAPFSPQRFREPAASLAAPAEPSRT